MERELDALEYETVDDLRNQVIDIMERYCSAATDEAAAYAARFYDDARALSAPSEAYSAEAVSGRVPEATDGAIRGIVQTIVDGHPWSTFAGKVLDRADYEIRRSANRCAIANADRDPAKPRWARVPTGSETCGFCIMLASRGYDYLRKESADHAHPNCDCRVVPRFGEGSIEGYEPEYYEDIYRRNAVSDDMGAVDVNATAFAIEKEARRAKAVSENIDYSMVPREEFGHLSIPWDYSPENITNRGREWRDIFVHDTLAVSGRSVVALPADAPKGFSNIDILVDGKLYEVKSPEAPKDAPKEGHELRFIENNLRKAVKQFGNQYDLSTGEVAAYDGEVCVVLNTRYRNVSGLDVEAEIRRQMLGHGIDEVLWIDENGNIETIR